MDGSLNTYTNALSQTLTMGYDGLRRLSTVTGGIYGKSYTYREITTTQTTSQVTSVVYDLPADQSFGYTYDNMGNIATYTDASGTLTYTYDDLGQLTRAVHGETTYAYTYDNAGNILTANGHTYTYGDTDGWTDLLTAIDGQSITYDAIGNPTSYYNGTRWAFTWTQGRQLLTAFTRSTTRDVGITYSYDADGLRTGKTVTAETYSAHTHSYTASQVVEPTCTQRGYTLYTCTCGLTAKNDYVAALGHDFTNSLGMVTATCERCGYKNGDYIVPVQPIVPPGSGVITSNVEITDANGTESGAGEVMTTSTADTRTLLSTTVKEYEYIYAGTTLVRMVVTTTVDDGTPAVQTLDFGYDASGMPVTVTTGGATYYYITNLQGDVMALVDSTGATVAEYSYDPYGGVIDATGDLPEINPLTYRGYVYDTETTLYYLQSRYYDPELGRFINADAYASTGQGVLGNNMFAYCVNNPILYTDPTGCVPIFPVCWGGNGSPLKMGPYDSADEAAQAFSEYIYSSSFYIRHEYGTEIYVITQNGQAKYYFNYPTAGTPHSVRVGYPVPEGAVMVAYAHTHPNSYSFSDLDISNAIQYGWDAYVVDQSRILHKYSLSTGSSTTLGIISPRGLTTVEKANLISQFACSWHQHIADGCEFGCKSKTWPRR